MKTADFLPDSTIRSFLRLQPGWSPAEHQRRGCSAANTALLPPPPPRPLHLHHHHHHPFFTPSSPPTPFLPAPLAHLNKAPTLKITTISCTHGWALQDFDSTMTLSMNIVISWSCGDKIFVKNISKKQQPNTNIIYAAHNLRGFFTLYSRDSSYEVTFSNCGRPCKCSSSCFQLAALSSAVVAVVQDFFSVTHSELVHF